MRGDERTSDHIGDLRFCRVAKPRSHQDRLAVCRNEQLAPPTLRRFRGQLTKSGVCTSLRRLFAFSDGLLVKWRFFNNNNQEMNADHSHVSKCGAFELDFPPMRTICLAGT